MVKPEILNAFFVAISIAFIEIGDASHWGTKIDDKIDFDARGDGYYEQNVYYHRDRGEPRISSFHWSTNQGRRV